MTGKKSTRQLAREAYMELIASSLPELESDDELIKKLIAPTWVDSSMSGIMIQPKDEKRPRLPRSTDLS